MPKKKTVKKCIRCNTTVIGGRSKYCSKKCSGGHSKETKLLLSKKRSEYLKNNPDKHPWKNNEKFKSVPCENVKTYLRNNNIEFIEELQPLMDRSYSIDIAFPHIMVAIEINGQQHYNSDGTLKEYYQKRHDLIENDGWKLIEVHYSQCFSDENISKFLNFDIPYDDKKIIKEYKEKQLRKKEERKVNPTLRRGEKQSLKTDATWQFKKDEIFNHNIDFSKFGWVTRVAVIWGIKHQKVHKWMKRYHEEFYENSCFRRKNS
jgi:very-short-patch-repair endonuclease